MKVPPRPQTTIEYLHFYAISAVYIALCATVIVGVVLFDVYGDTKARTTSPETASCQTAFDHITEKE